MGNTKIRPIAMKCNQEQFEAIKLKLSSLRVEDIYSFGLYEYLVNNYCNEKNVISNSSNGHKLKFDRIVYETWNEEIFLNSCGIETEKTYTITKEQLLELENGFTLPKLKQWFPDVFEVKLELGKWYYQTDSKALVNFQSGTSGYGFDFSGTWNDLTEHWSFKSHAEEWRLATEQEVFEALKNEAVNRGFKEGVYITPMYSDGNDYFADENIINKPINFHLKGNTLEVDGGADRYRIFVNRKWATIIPTLTKKEAEEKLNCKIV